MRIFYSLILVSTLLIGGCCSTNSGSNPINRSTLIDTGLKLGGNIPILPFPLPEFDFGFRLNVRRPTIQEEVDLNLSKVGKWRDQPAPPLASPKPFSLRDNTPR